ncbi:MAG: sel1 repeat family protein [Candidatus Paracaedibacteraceae bacterium]|nr:sel1 repeat family protein [Candidatus Paracaedibacteraceae bacterium]
MHKRLLSSLLLNLSSQAFDQAELLFEKKDYTGAVTTFLRDTQINDARVFPFLQYCQENNLIDPDALEGQTKSDWVERLDHAQFAPTGYPGGDVFLKISLLAQSLDTNQKDIASQIESLSNQYQTGYGYFILARYQEAKLGQKPSNSQIKTTIKGYLKAAKYADPYSILALDRLKSVAGKHNIKIEKSYLHEAQYLKSQGILSVNAESGLPETTLSRLYTAGGKLPGTPPVTLPKNAHRKAQWQFVAAQKGNADIQIMFSYYANKLSIDLPSIPSAETPQQLRWFYLAALSGSFDAQHKLGEAFSENPESSFAPDINRSIYWFTRALESFKAIQPTDLNYTTHQKSHSRCLQMLGTIYDKGLSGIEVDESKALDYFRTAAELYEDPTALYNTGSMIDNGRGTQIDPAAAKKYFERASNKGDQNTSLLLAKRYLNGSGDVYPKNQILAFGYLKRAKDLPEAKYLLSGLLAHVHPGFDTFNIPKDEQEAARLLREAAQEGDKDAQNYWVAKNLNQRETLPPSDQELLIKFVITLAKENNTTNIEQLCLLMIENFKNHFENCDEKIHEYLVLLEKEKSEFAYCNLGYAYEQGLWGFELSLETAIKYYRLAPDHHGAQTNLGFCLEQTQGRTASDEIVGLYKKSLALGNPIAANNLGALYQNGVIVEKDDELAEMYYGQGAEMGDADATVQYISYGLSRLRTTEELSDLIQLTHQLDLNEPYHQYVTATVLINTEATDTAINLLVSAATSGVIQAQYTLGLYLYITSSNFKDDRKLAMRKEAFIFLQNAEDAGFELAKSANRILRRNISLNQSQEEKIAKKLLAGKKEEARQVLQDARQAQVSTTKQIESYIPEEKTPSSAPEQRLMQDLEVFLDPQNNITFQDFQRIVTHLGGSVTNGKGSGVHVSLNGQKTGVHRMHRSGQSSNVNLDPGRASSLRDFIQNAMNQ